MTNPNTSTSAAMLEKVRKLIAQADSVAGTPEADIFQAKAMELMAKYQIDQAMLRGADDRTQAVAQIVELSGRYVDMQLVLLHSLSRANWCSLVQLDKRRLHLFGMPGHVETTLFLFRQLVASMGAQAAKARPPYPVEHSGELRVYRRSFMRGFASEVGSRLRAAQRVNREATAGGERGELVLVSDAKKAEAAMRAQYPRLRTARSSGRVDAYGAQAGKAAGSRADIGQSRVGGKLAIGR